MQSRILAVTLRSLTLAIRFALSLVVARSLALEQAGLFFLYLAGVQIASALLPLDLYASTARAVLRDHDQTDDTIAADVGRHFGAVAFLAVVLGPLAAVILFISSPSIGVAFVLLFPVHVGFEAISNDIGRMLVPLSRPLVAAAFLFLRSAVWIIPVAILYETGLWDTDAFGLALLWFGASVLAATFGMYLICRRTGPQFRLSLTLNWLQRNLRKSLLFLAGSLVFRVVTGGDRFLVERALGLDAVAVYGFYVSLSFGLLALLETGSSAWNYPQLVKAIQSKNGKQTRSVLIRFIWQNSFGAIALTSVLAFGFPLVAGLILDPVYVENIELLHLICLGVLLLGLSLPFQYVVYGFGRDDFRLIAMTIGAVVLFLAWYRWLPSAGLSGAGMMMASSVGAIASVRLLAAAYLMFTAKHWDKQPQ